MIQRNTRDIESTALRCSIPNQKDKNDEKGKWAAHDLAGVTFYVSFCHKVILRWWEKDRTYSSYILPQGLYRVSSIKSDNSVKEDAEKQLRRDRRVDIESITSRYVPASIANSGVRVWKSNDDVNRLEESGAISRHCYGSHLPYICPYILCKIAKFSCVNWHLLRQRVVKLRVRSFDKVDKLDEYRYPTVNVC